MKRALEFRKHVRKNLAQRLANVLYENVQVKGFRPVSVPRAPLPKLISPVAEAIQHSEELMEAIIAVWVESHADLCTTVHDFLITQDLPAMEIHDLQLGFSRTCAVSELFFLVDAFEAENPGHDRDDIALMVCCLSGQMPVPDDFIEEATKETTMDSSAVNSEQGEGAMIWEEWLNELRAMPASAPEWEKIPDFLVAVEQIFVDKKQERESEAPRRELNQAFTLLNKQCENGISFFQMNCAAWSAEACSPAEATALLEKVEQLRKMLERYMELRGRPTENLEDEKSRREELEPLEQQIGSLYGEINELAFIPNEEQTKPGTKVKPAIEDKSLADDAVRKEQIIQEVNAPTKAVVGDNGIEEAKEGEVSADSEDDLSMEETSEEAKPSGEEAIKERSLVADKVSEEQSQQEESVPTETTVEDREIGETEADEVPAGSDMTAESASELTEEAGAAVLIPEPDAQELEQEDEQAKELETDESDSKDDLSVEETSEETGPSGSEIDAKLEAAESLTFNKQVSEKTVSPLLSTHQVAEILLEDYTDENWPAFLWALIAEGDLAGAYWLSRSLDVSGRSNPVPEWLLAALQGSRWLSSDSSNLAIDLAAIATKHQPGLDEAQRLLALAAAANPSLIAPETGLMSWLEDPADFPHLHNLVYAISQFTNLGKPLHPEDLMGTEGRRERKSAISKVIADISRRLEMVQGRRLHTKIKRASDILRILVSQGGDLHEVLDTVCKDDRDMVERVCESLEEWQKRDRIIKAIVSADSQVSRRRSRPIVGSALEQIVRDIQGICQKARYWCELVIHEKEAQRKGNWLAEQAGQLQSHLQDILPKVESMANEQIAASQSAHLAASMICIRKSMEQLRGTLHLALPEPVQLSILEQDWMYADAEDLDTALSHRLLLLPDILLDNDGQPEGDAIPQIAGLLRDAYVEGRTVRDAIVGWLARQDYRFLHTLSSALSDEDAIPYSEQQQGSQKALDDACFSVTDAIEQAVVDGVISDEERTQYSARVEEIKHPEVPNFQPMHDELKEIVSELDGNRQSRLASLKDEWQLVKTQLSIKDAKDQERLIHFVESALGRGDTRLVEECIALIQTSEATKEIDEDWLSSLDRRETDVLADFMDSVKPIEKWLERGLRNAANGISQGKTGAGFSFRQIPSTRLKEAHDAILAWNELKRRGAGSSDSNRRQIATILSYLGFNIESYTPRNVSIEQVSRDLLHAQVSMSYGGDLALPQFGSKARGRYDVLCLWERPGMGTIDARLRELRLNNHSTIVLYLGRLTIRQRNDLVRITREQESALAILDEILLLFLARELDTRLPAFFLCTLPFVAINPYTPFQAGDVPKEMFFGRKDMALELQRAEGSCMVYGGRQLGKSALLRQVEREFHHPERDQYAWVEDIKLVGDTQPTEAIWQRVREALKKLGLISTRVKTEKGDAIAGYIREAFENKQRRALFMFDEADNFLDADANNGFAIVEKLRQLMFGTNRRFKVVFTGLHNVQRFQGIPNQPLAHFGTALCVGPLEPDAAQKLVQQPMEALGYRFSENSSILRILSYTNYHPGLIQLFCRELIDYLRPRNANRLPPYGVTKNDVEAVYRNPQVRDSIRERFDWTLALDPAYQTIAWAMIVDQMDARDGYAQVYGVHDIQKFVLDWWPQGFQKSNIDRLKGLLEEMRGLGVLARNQDGYYRLRSPNLVRLMGTDRDIEDRLVEVSERSPKEVFEPDSHRMPLDNAARSYSPLTYAQERNLMIHEFGACLVFGSDGLGLSSLPSVFRRFLDPDSQNGGQVDLSEVPSNILTSDAMTEWLGQHLRKNQNCERLIAYQIVTGSAEGAIERIESSQRFCLSRRHSRRQWMRIIFIFDPKASWAWFSLPVEIRHKVENSAEALLVLQRWNEVAIRRRLFQQRHLHLMDTSEVSQSVLEATNGWPILIDVFFERCEKSPKLDPTPIAQSIREQAESKGTTLNMDFSRSVGVLEDTPHMRILEFIGRADGLSREYITPDLMEGGSDLSQEECDATIEYLQHMGCIEVSEGEFRIEPVIWDALVKL